MFKVCEYNKKLAFFKFEQKLTIDEQHDFDTIQKLWNLIFDEDGVYCHSEEDLEEMSEFVQAAYDHVINSRP